jgi:hypothetical protein
MDFILCSCLSDKLEHGKKFGLILVDYHMDLDFLSWNEIKVPVYLFWWRIFIINYQSYYIFYIDAHIIIIIYFLFLSSYSLLSLIFEIFDLMLSDWISFLAYPNLFGIKGFVVVVVVVVCTFQSLCSILFFLYRWPLVGHC